MDFQNENISSDNFEQCTKCTICTVVCPVTPVRADYPGPKQAGPDGKRYRLKDAVFFDAALKYCLNCKRCEVACPSDVRIGDLILKARIEHDRHRPSFRDSMLADTDTMGSLATICAPLVNFTISTKPVKYILDRTLGIDSHRRFPDYTTTKFTTWFNRHAKAEQDKFKRHISYYHGCYVNYNYPTLGRKFVEIYNAVGIGVRLLDKERCCGVAKIANRLISDATRDAKINIESIRKALAGGSEAVVASSSTCCFTMRDEYPHVLGVDNSDVRSSITLAVAHLSRLIESGEIKLVFRKDYRKRIAYHTPCHMERMGFAQYSTGILASIPGVELTVLNPNCCGMAGTYGFKKENYETSQAIGSAIFDQINSLQPDFVSTDCETCKWQIEMSTDFKVRNPLEVVFDALDIEATKRANNVI